MDMKSAKWWTGLLAAAVVAAGLVSEAQGETTTVNGQRWWYGVEEGQATVTNGPIRGDIVIPSSLGGYPVTEIGWYAFEGCRGITSVKIPSSVRSINRSAFARCTGLTTVDIPEGVTRIGDWVFSGCSNLYSVRIPDSVTSMGSGVFMQCADQLYARSRGYLHVDGWVVDTDPARDWPSSLDFTGFRGIVGGAIHGKDNKNLTRVTIGNTVRVIGDYAFSDCTNLCEIAIPGNVKIIAERAFVGCSNLTTVTIENGVECIEYGAFKNCTALSSVTIPDSVIKIADGVFQVANTSPKRNSFQVSWLSMGGQPTVWSRFPANWT